MTGFIVWAVSGIGALSWLMAWRERWMMRSQIAYYTSQIEKTDRELLRRHHEFDDWRFGRHQKIREMEGEISEMQSQITLDVEQYCREWLTVKLDKELPSIKRDIIFRYVTELRQIGSEPILEELGE